MHFEYCFIFKYFIVYCCKCLFFIWKYVSNLKMMLFHLPFFSISISSSSSFIHFYFSLILRILIFLFNIVLVLRSFAHNNVTMLEKTADFYSKYFFNFSMLIISRGKQQIFIQNIFSTLACSSYHGNEYGGMEWLHGLIFKPRILFNVPIV